MQAKRGGLAAEGPGTLRDRVVTALPEVLPDVELLDRDLALGEGRRADLVAVDAVGRLALVLLAGGEGDEPILASLDALDFLQRNRAVLGAHLRCARIDAGAAPLVLLVSEGFSERLLRRLGGLDREQVRCFELRTLASSREERSYLVEVPSGGPARADPRAGARELLRALQPEHRPLAEILMRRVARIDEELELATGERGVVWSLAGEPLCTLLSQGGSLRAQVGRSPRNVAIEDRRDVEALVEELLELHLQALHAGGGGNDQEGASAEARRAPGGEGGPLLTPEELAAFREPL